MGAATALMYCGETENVDELVKCMVIDSPFTSLDELAHDIVGKFNLPTLARFSFEFSTPSSRSISPRKAIMMYGMGKAEAVLKQRMGFEVADLQPRRASLQCRLPVLMIHGIDDDFILPKHSESIFKEYAGEEKRLLLVCTTFICHFAFSLLDDMISARFFRWQERTMACGLSGLWITRMFSSNII
jgi:fermentation-respiration switch protein FrsA (DUF1100 family)